MKPIQRRAMQERHDDAGGVVDFAHVKRVLADFGFDLDEPSFVTAPPAAQASRR